MSTSTEGIASEQAEEPINVQAAEFEELTGEAESSALGLDLILDISMPITVELGRASMTVEELLKLGTGAVVELDRLAGEPIDLFVRGVRFAKGEVVVVDNKFGFRITEIINPQRRIQQLGQ